MNKTLVFLMIVVSLALVCPGLAQMGPGGGGLGMGPGGGMGPRLYNPQTVTTVKGQVKKIEELTMGRGGMGMAFREVLLKTEQGSLVVHLGPGWFLDQNKFTLKAGDTMEVTGSKVTLNNQPALIAREATVNGKTLKLRDEQGLPAWRSMGRGLGAPQGQRSGDM